MSDNWFHILLQIENAGDLGDQTLRFWSGLKNLQFEDHTWIGAGSVLSSEGVETSIGAAAHVLTVGLSGLHPTVRTHFRAPIGHLPATMRFIRSADGGATWVVLPMKRFGFTSSPRMQGGVYLVDIVHPFEVAFRRRAINWSDEDQRRRYDNDNGLSEMRAISEGTNIKFPYLRELSK